jgi:hypothetical protein
LQICKVGLICCQWSGTHESKLIKLVVIKNDTLKVSVRAGNGWQKQSSLVIR